MQENTQSNIIRKLNSHTRYSGLRAALFEYNKIFKSAHVLKLIDDMQLRKAIRTARNRTEAYHQLQGIIRKISTGMFKGKKMVKNGVAQEIIEEFARISPIAWAHLLFTGRYSFKKNSGNIDVEAMANMLEQSFWKQNELRLVTFGGSSTCPLIL